MLARRELRGRRSRDHGTHGKSSPKPFRKGDDVGMNTFFLITEPVSSPSHPCLYRIHGEECVS